MGFNIDHDYPMKSGFFEDATPIAFCLLLGAITLAVLYRKKYKLLSFGILWFFIALSVESSILPIRDAMFEHRVYLAFPGISILLSFILTQTLPIKKTCKICICGAIILGCTVITYSRAKVWTSELSLWQDASQKAPHNARAWNNYGNALIANGQKDQAADAFQNAIIVNPEYARPYCNLGKFYAEKGDLTKSEKLFLKSIELDPKFAEPHNNLAINYASSGNLEKGIQHFQKSLKINPNIAHTHYNMGKVYLDADQPEEALKHFLRATSLNPDLNPMVYYLTAAAYASMNQPESAAQWVTEAIKRGIDQSIEHIKTDPRFASCRESVLSKISN
jgi:Tfp pilus assembly protein PilF/drug/metabolite transporter superfamily protein YnfA